MGFLDAFISVKKTEEIPTPDEVKPVSKFRKGSVVSAPSQASTGTTPLTLPISATSEREKVLEEFGLAICDNGDTCDHYDCVGERVMADEIVRLRAIPPAPRVVVLDEWRVLDKDGVRESYFCDFYYENEAHQQARLEDRDNPDRAPHRVVRVALVEDANHSAPLNSSPRVVSR